jgi:hypothetical protein
MNLQKRLVRGHHGWTILPAVGIAGDLTGDTLSAAPLCEPEIWRSIVLGMPRTGRVPASVEVVARELDAQVESLVAAHTTDDFRLAIFCFRSAGSTGRPKQNCQYSVPSSARRPSSEYMNTTQSADRAC